MRARKLAILLLGLMAAPAWAEAGGRGFSKAVSRTATEPVIERAEQPARHVAPARRRSNAPPVEPPSYVRRASMQDPDTEHGAFMINPSTRGSQEAVPSPRADERYSAPAGSAAEEGSYYPQGDGEFVDEGFVEGDGYGPDPWLSGNSCGNPCCCQPPLTVMWGEFDYLMWWAKGMQLPVLVTTSPAGTARPNAGVLGVPGTTVLYGNDRVGDTLRNGGRLNLGLWLDPQQHVGIGGSFFALQDRANDYTNSSNGNPILARPYFNAETNANNAQLVAYPNILHGTVNVKTTSSVLGAEAYLRENMTRGALHRLDMLWGYQFFRMNDSLSVDDTLVNVGGTQAPIGTTLTGGDQFSANNYFNGGLIGMTADLYDGPWVLTLVGKIAFGSVHQSVDISGNTTTVVPGDTPVTTAGSLLALPTNIGSYSRNQFAVLPEVNVNLGYQLTYNWRLRFGYTFMYLSRVAQSSQQVDTTINPSQIGGDPLVGAARPTFSWRASDYWVQGLNFGLEYRY